MTDSVLICSALALLIIGVVLMVLSGLFEFIKWTRYKRRYDRACKEIDKRIRQTGHF